MLELIENKSTKNRRKKYHLLVDKELIKAKIRSFTKDEELLINVSTTDLSAAKILCKYKFQDYPNLNYISLALNLPEAIYLAKVGITYNSPTKRYELKFRYSASLNIWKDRENYLRLYGIYSNLIADLNYSTSDIAKRYKHNNLKPEISNISQRSGFEITFSVHSLEGTLLDEIKSYSKILIEYHLEALSVLVNSKKFENSKIIETIFNFPLSIKINCQQYLLYFAQFLQDLGINATSNLKEEAGKVLFSVTPIDNIEALDKIHEALAIYLSLFSNPITHSTGDRTVDMVLSGARANAKHLESQLELAIAKLQFKEATLELKDATIEQNQLALRQRDDKIKDLKEMLARGNIFEESLEKVVINGEVVEETSLYRFSREDDIEVESTPVLDENNEETRIGLVKFHEVTKLKDYGVSLDLPKAIRNLIDYFKRDKNK